MDDVSTVPPGMDDDHGYVEDYAFMVCRTLEKLYNTFSTRVITDQRLAIIVTIIPGKLNWLLNVHVVPLSPTYSNRPTTPRR